MSTKPLVRLDDLLLAHGFVEGEERNFMALLLLVWISRQKKTDQEFLIDHGARAIQVELEEIAAEGFPVALKLENLPEFDGAALVQASILMRDWVESGDDAPAGDFPALAAAVKAGFTVAPGVLTMMGQLLAPESAELTYVPWDENGQLSAALASLGAFIRIESESPAIAMLVGMLQKKSWHITACEPILETVDDGAKYTSSAAILPFGSMFSTRMLEQLSPLYFPERTTSASVLGIRRMLAVTSGRIVVAVQNNVLFSSGAEYSLRQELLKRGQLRTVIAMPAGLLNYIGIAFSVLVIDVKGGNELVRFVNAALPRFNTANRINALRHVDELVQLSTGVMPGPEAVCVPVRELLENDAQLQAERYVVTEKGAVARSILSTARTVTLEDLVSVLRPPLIVKATDIGKSFAVLEAMEVGAGDLPQFGYISQATRPVKIEDKSRTAAHYLRAHDIVIVVKGSVGKVGIVPSNQASPEQWQWTAGQAAIVLRMRENAPIDARALFVQLRSPFGQELIKSIVSGASMPIIQLKELRELRVILPDQEEQRQAVEALEEEAVAEAHIATYRAQQELCAKHLWQLA